MCLFVYWLVRNDNVFHVVAPNLDFNPIYNWCWGFPFSYCVIWFAYHGPRLLAEIPRRVGDLSYGLYIWHLVVIYTVVYLFTPAQLLAAPAATEALIIGASFGVAALSWWLVERPALQLKRYSSRRSREALPPPPILTLPAEPEYAGMSPTP